MKRPHPLVPLLFLPVLDEDIVVLPEMGRP